MPCMFNQVQDSLASHCHPLLCLPHDGCHTWLGNASEMLIGIKAFDRLVVYNDVAAQDAVQHLPACLVAFRNGFLEEFDKGSPDINTVLAQGSFCAGAGMESDHSYANESMYTRQMVHTCSILDPFCKIT